MNTPLLTLITITKDDPGGLSCTLISAKAWRGVAWVEQIVVDGSARPVEVDDQRIVVVHQTSIGIARAFNEGLARARGEWVWFINGGDQIDARLEPAWLKALLDATQADVVIGGTIFPGDVAPRPPPPPKWQWPPFVPWIPHPSTLVRRALFSRFGDFDPTYKIALDFEWWLRSLSEGVAVDQVLVPFAVFAPGGVSLREETQGETKWETERAVWRHRGRLLRSWAGITRRYFKYVVGAGWRQLRRNNTERRRLAARKLADQIE